MATHSSILAWRIPWTEKPGRLQSMWPQRVRHWATFTKHFHPEFKATYTSLKSLFLPQHLKQGRNGEVGISGRKKQWGSVPVPLPKNTQGQGVSSHLELRRRGTRVSWVTCQELTAPMSQARASDLDWMLKLWFPRSVLAAAQWWGPLPLTSKPVCWWH